MADSSQKAGNQKFPVLVVGADPTVTTGLEDLFAHCDLVHLPMDMDKLIDKVKPGPLFVICGMPPAELPMFELAQGVRMTYTMEPIFLVCNDRSRFDRKSFLKNGFTDVFLLPMDRGAMRLKIEELLAKASSGAIKSYRPVKLLDIKPGTVLDFDTNILLPLNKRYIKISAAGDEVDQKRIDQLKKHQLNSIYVRTDELDKFYKYTAERLRELNSGAENSTQKGEQVQQAVRELLGGIFNEQTESNSFEEGRALVSNCQAIVKSYISTTDSGHWYKKLDGLMKEMGDFYAHGSNVASLAALFSMGLGIGKPEDMAVAGILHDIGMADVPQQILAKPEADRTTEDWSAYRKHPEHSVNIIKKRRLILPESVITAIAQHHERYDGSGYPQKLPGKKISPEAQLLAIADMFDELITVTEGRPRRSPKDVLDYFKEIAAGRSHEGTPFDPNLLKRFLELFKDQLNSPQ